MLNHFCVSQNYFEWGNAECMCATCESRGAGAFAVKGEPQESDQPDAESSTEPNGDGSGKSRRISLRRSSASLGKRKRPDGGSPSLPSPSPTPSGSGSTRGSLEDSRTDADAAGPSSPKRAAELAGDDEARTLAAGPRCTCVTCGAIFYAPEKWWTPDECGRCERHYKIFKADWPCRVSQGSTLSRKSKGKEKAREQETLLSNGSSTPVARRRGRPPKSANATDTGSPASTPAKDSPLRDARPSDVGRPPGSRPRGRPRKDGSSRLSIAPPNDDEAADDGTDEDAKGVDEALQALPRTKKRSPSPSPSKSVSTSRVKEETPDAMAKALTSKVPSRTLKRGTFSDSDSDLTPESEDESGDEAAQANGSDSSSISSAPGGPKMLGKEARTETLALYWGAPTGDRRARRQSSHGPVSLTGQRSLNGLRSEAARRSHRRVNSDGRSAATSGAVDGSDEEEEDNSPPPAKRSHKKKVPAPVLALSTGPSSSSAADSESARTHRKTASLNDMAAFAGAGPSDRSGSADPVLAKRSHKKKVTLSAADEDGAVETVSVSASAPALTVPSAADDGDVSMEDVEEPTLVRDVLTKSNGEAAAGATDAAASSPPPGAPIPGLATKGPERTSIQNLALFWSAGIEGEGRTRRQAKKEPITLSQAPEKSALAKRPRLSSEDSRSSMPEQKRPRGRPPKLRMLIDDVASDPERSANKPVAVLANGHRASRASTGSPRVLGREVDTDEERGGSPRAGPSREEAEKKKPRWSGHKLGEAWVPEPDNGGANGVRRSSLPVPSPVATGSSTPAHFVAPRAAQSPVAAQASGTPRPGGSPLASSAALSASTAGPPRAAPGQPIRRNLRWGSGKVSTSRPLPAHGQGQGQPPGSTSPLNRTLETNSPNASPGNSPQFAQRPLGLGSPYLQQLSGASVSNSNGASVPHHAPIQSSTLAPESASNLAQAMAERQVVEQEVQIKVETENTLRSSSAGADPEADGGARAGAKLETMNGSASLPAAAAAAAPARIGTGTGTAAGTGTGTGTGTGNEVVKNRSVESRPPPVVPTALDGTLTPVPASTLSAPQPESEPAVCTPLSTLAWAPVRQPSPTAPRAQAQAHPHPQTPRGMTNASEPPTTPRAPKTPTMTEREHLEDVSMDTNPDADADAETSIEAGASSSGGRRTSGRVRRPRELHPGLVEYRGSLLKLTAEKARAQSDARRFPKKSSADVPEGGTGAVDESSPTTTKKRTRTKQEPSTPTPRSTPTLSGSTSGGYDTPTPSDAEARMKPLPLMPTPSPGNGLTPAPAPARPAAPGEDDAASILMLIGSQDHQSDTR